MARAPLCRKVKTVDSICKTVDGKNEGMNDMAYFRQPQRPSRNHFFKTPNLLPRIRVMPLKPFSDTNK